LCPSGTTDNGKALERLRTDTMPFVNLPEKKGAHAMDKEKMQQVHWLKPKLIAEIAFNERTARGHLRHSKFVRAIKNMAMPLTDHFMTLI
jgi:ATP-dependent DNA ligase